MESGEREEPTQRRRNRPEKKERELDWRLMEVPSRGKIIPPGEKGQSVNVRGSPYLNERRNCTPGYGSTAGHHGKILLGLSKQNYKETCEKLHSREKKRSVKRKEGIFTTSSYQGTLDSVSVTG